MTDNNDFEADILTLTDEEGVERNFAVIGDLELDGNNYLALVPEDSEEDEYIVLKIAVDENGEEMLITVDDDDEFDKVADAFEDQLMAEYDCDCDECGHDCDCCTEENK